MCQLTINKLRDFIRIIYCLTIVQTMANGNENIVNENQWRSHAYRQAVVNKIESTLQETGLQCHRSYCSEVENFIYNKVNARHEYLITIAQFILHTKKQALQHQSGSIDLDEVKDAANALMDLSLVIK